MSFDTYETGTETGTPGELFELKIGTEEYFYTSDQNDITIGGSAYVSKIITRDDIQISSDEKDKRIQVEMPASDPFIQKYKIIAPGKRATLTIYRYHRDDSAKEKIVAFKGTVRVVGFLDNGRKARMTADPVITGVRSRTIPRRTFQNICNHTLFDGYCKILESAHTHNLTVTAVSGNTITASGAATVGADAFVAGTVIFNEEYRMVTAQSGDVLTLVMPFVTSPLNATVACLKGCKLRLSEDCVTRYSNGDNYGGFKYVPTKNPFETGLD